jgi:hypothetical protein
VAIPYRKELTAFIDEFAEQHRGVRRGQMFGLPAIYAGRRLVTCLIEDGIIVRMPEDVARREIQSKRGVRYSHGGRDSRNWVLYRPRTAVAARSLAPLIEAAVRDSAERQTEEITGIRLKRARRS